MDTQYTPEQIKEAMEFKAREEAKEQLRLDTSRVFHVASYTHKKQLLEQYERELTALLAKECHSELKDIFTILDPNKNRSKDHTVESLVSALTTKIEKVVKAKTIWPMKVNTITPNFFMAAYSPMVDAPEYSKDTGRHKLTVELIYPNCVVGARTNSHGQVIGTNAFTTVADVETESFAPKVVFTRRLLGL